MDIALESYKQCHEGYETNSINVFVEHAGYEVFSVFFWKDEAMGAGAQVVYMGASGREECVKDVAGVNCNVTRQATLRLIKVSHHCNTAEYFGQRYKNTQEIT